MTKKKERAIPSTLLKTGFIREGFRRKLDIVYPPTFVRVKKKDKLDTILDV